MPRRSRSLPKYRKHKARNLAVVEINGRDHYLGPYGTAASRREYDRLIAEWLASDRSTSFGAAAAQYTVVELVVDYLTWAKGYYGSGPRGTYATMVRVCRPLRQMYSRLPAEDFTVLQFKAIRQQHVDAGQARSYVNENMRRIVAVFRWGAAEGKLAASVPQSLAIIPGLRKGRGGARETSPIRPVDAAVVEATLPHMPPIVADMVRLQQLTGARPGEVCQLRPCHVDRSHDPWEARLVEHKTAHHGRDRVVLIGPQSQDLLRPYLLREAGQPCFSPAETMEQLRRARHAARVTPMSCGNRPGSNRRRRPKRRAGEQYTSQSYGAAIRTACRRAFPHPSLGSVPLAKLTAEQLIELKAWNKAHCWAPNQLRHATATEVRRQFGLEAAQVVLGHAAVGVTQVYAERDLAKAREVVRQIG